VIRSPRALLSAALLTAACAQPAVPPPVPVAPVVPAAEVPPPTRPFAVLRKLPIAAWTQAEREYVFPRWDAYVHAIHVVKRGARPHPLPDGAPLAALQPGSPLATRLDRDVAEHQVVGLLVLVDGKVRLERYAHGQTAGGRWPSFSVVKSITSTLVGAALQDGFIRSVDDPVTQYIPELAGSAYDGVTVRQVLTMTSGVKWNEDYSDPASDVVRFYQTPVEPGVDATVSYLRKLPREAPPGQKWVYKTGETNLLGVLVAAATKKPLADYLSEKIWSAYGMETDAVWQLDRSGHEHGGSGLAATLRDFARFGQFILEGGVVDGRPVLPADWLPTATRKQEDTDEPGTGYGYQWWTRDDGTFFAVGIHGQMVSIDRPRRLVIALNSVWPVATGKAEREGRAELVRTIAAAVDAESRSP
jgi:CubicO group peptidase (beta-lactamase class C family)